MISLTFFLIFEGSLLRIILFWISIVHHTSVSLKNNLSHLTFSEFCRLNAVRLMRSFLTKRKYNFLASLFSEMLMFSSSNGFVEGIYDRFHYLFVFIRNFFLPPKKIDIRNEIDENISYIDSVL